MLDALKSNGLTGKGATKVVPKSKSPFGGGTKSKSPFGGGTKSKSPFGGGSKAGSMAPPKKTNIKKKKKKKKSHDFEEVEESLCQLCVTETCGMFLSGLSGVHQGCASIVTCGVCFDRYSEKQQIIVPPDSHDLKCQPDTKVLSWVTILVIVVGAFSYLISITFEELPMYVRVELFNKADCKTGTISMIEYVPTVTCLKWRGQSISVKKRREQLSPGQDSADVVQSGRPPKKPMSVVYTFTEHYMWGLSWYADMYEREGCLSATGIPDSIAKVESDETGLPLAPLYAKEQILDVCLSRDRWDYEYKSARLLGSRCLGNHQMQDLLGMYDDPECKSLVKAVAYNLTYYKKKSSPKNTKKWGKCTKSEVDQMYYKRVVVTPLCASKYDVYGKRIQDNGISTNEVPCDSELVCPDGNGGMTSGTEEVIEVSTILIIVLFSFVMPVLLLFFFYCMNCHEVQERFILRDKDEDERLARELTQKRL